MNPAASVHSRKKHLQALAAWVVHSLPLSLTLSLFSTLSFSHIPLSILFISLSPSHLGIRRGLLATLQPFE